MAHCKTCGASILWVVVGPSKKTTPINAQPDPERGNIRLTDKLAYYMSEEERLAYQGPRYLSHFATCPQATQHRRRP